jgi:hypothetical protein
MVFVGYRSANKTVYLAKCHPTSCPKKRRLLFGWVHALRPDVENQKLAA